MTLPAPAPSLLNHALILRSVLIFTMLGVATAALPGGLHASTTEEVQGLLDQAEELLAQRQPEEALRIFRKAAKKGGPDCLDCHLGLARGYRAMGAHKDALEEAEKGLALGPEGAARAAFHSEVGLAQLGLGDKGSPRVAAEHFQKAIDLAESPTSNLYFNLGVSLLRDERDEEGIAALEKLLEVDPVSPLARQARSLIDEPRRARENLVPDFSIATLDGELLSPEELDGKVVLYDFWATWCGPCHRALPNLRRLHKKLADAPFVLVSISSDQDEATLREFIDREDMTWPQVHDKTGRVTHEAFQVRGFPTYVLVDHEGRVILRRSGWSQRLDLEVSAQVKKATKQARKAGAA